MGLLLLQLRKRSQRVPKSSLQCGYAFLFLLIYYKLICFSLTFDFSLLFSLRFCYWVTLLKLVCFCVCLFFFPHIINCRFLFWLNCNHFCVISHSCLEGASIVFFCPSFPVLVWDLSYMNLLKKILVNLFLDKVQTFGLLCIILHVKWILKYHPQLQSSLWTWNHLVIFCWFRILANVMQKSAQDASFQDLGFWK